MIEDESLSPKERLKPCKLLARSQAAFTDNVNVHEFIENMSDGNLNKMLMDNMKALGWEVVR